MKRGITLLLGAALAMSLCACGNTAPTPETTAPAVTVTTEAPILTRAEACRALLAGEITFTDHLTGGSIPLPAGSLRLAIQDLDGDGERELILGMPAGSDEDIGYWVLRYREGLLLGDPLPPWDLEDLKTDGSFTLPTGPDNDGIGIVEFTDTGLEVICTGRHEEIWGEGGKVEEVIFTVDGKSATEKEFREARRLQEEKPDTPWYYASPENLDRADRQAESGKMIDILSGNGVFYNHSANMYMTLEEYLAHTAPDASLSAIAPLDLDGDGQKEAVLQRSDKGVLVLRQQEDAVHGVDFDASLFKNLKTDGTFSWGGRDEFGGSDQYRGTAKMDFTLWARKDIHRTELNPAAGGRRYYINSLLAGRDGFDRAMKAQEAKEDALWLSYPCPDYSEIMNGKE